MHVTQTNKLHNAKKVGFEYVIVWAMHKLYVFFVFFFDKLTERQLVH